MQVKREDVSPCLVTLDIEVEPDHYASALQRARKDLGKRTEVAGFRRGKAPMAVLERVLDPERVTRLAGDYIMPDAVQEAVKQHDLDPWDAPSVETLEPATEGGFRFKAMVPLMPRVTLGDYINLDIERPSREVTEDLVDTELDRLQKQHTRLEPREEGVIEDEDYVFVSMQEIDDGGEPKGEPNHHAAVVGENVPDFDANLRGMAKDETREFTMHYPEDWPEEHCAGTTVKVRIQPTQVYRQIKPDLNDDFAKTVGEFENLDALKNEIRSAITRAFAQQADEEVEDRIIQKVVENSTVEYPPQMQEDHYRRRVQEIFQDLERRKITFDQYLEQSKTTEEQFRSALRQRVDFDLRAGLALGEVAEKEDLKVDAEEVERDVSAMQSSDVSEQFKQYADSDEGRASLRRRKLYRKTLDFLRAASNIRDVPVPAAPAGQQEQEA